MRHPLVPSALVLTASLIAVTGCTSTSATTVTPTEDRPSATVPAPTALMPSPTSGQTSPSPAPDLSPPPSSSSASPTYSNPVSSGLAAGPAPAGTFVLGDSIILGAGVGPPLAQYGYAVVGVVGQSATTDYLRRHLSTPIAQSAHSWVIELGTNNSGDPSDVARIAGMVEVIKGLRTAGARQKVYWVTPYRPSTYVGSKTRYSLDGFTAELARLAQENPWLRLIDWAAVARLHEEWFASDAMHLHPDATGQAVLLAMIAGPDATPVDVPSPLITEFLSTPSAGADGAYQEPETFDNSTMPPSTPDASSPVAATPMPVPTTSAEASTGG